MFEFLLQVGPCSPGTWYRQTKAETNLVDSKGSLGIAGGVMRSLKSARGEGKERQSWLSLGGMGTTGGQRTPMRAIIVYLLLLLGTTVLPAAAGEDKEPIETARLLAILLDSGRATIARNQVLINDPSKGDKGFTSDVFEQQLIGNFKERTGIDLGHLQEAAVSPNAKRLLARLLEESRKTVDSYQFAINVPGIKYKGFIPATFGTETASRFQRWSGIYMKQTAPDGVLRNPKNKADDFEVRALSTFAGPDYPRNGENIISETVDDGKAVRIMLPLFYAAPCLTCHGEPKGERDMSGYPREGGKVGDLGGAISVKIGMNSNEQPAGLQTPNHK
jgi:hypothetical protein